MVASSVENVEQSALKLKSAAIVVMRIQIWIIPISSALNAEQKLNEV